MTDDRDVGEIIRDDTCHSIIQTLLGHPTMLASADDISHYIPSRSDSEITEGLDELVDAGIVEVVEHPAYRDIDGLPSVFYGFSKRGIEVLGEYNVLKGRPMARAAHERTPGPATSTDTDHCDELDEEEVVAIYEAYAVNGCEPAEVADEMRLDLAAVHEAIAYYYRHSDQLMDARNIDPPGGGEGFDTLSIDEFIDENQTADEL